MQRKVLISGGAGFIGSTIAEKLCAAGDDVLVYDNLSFGRADFLPQAARLVAGDVLDPALLNETVGNYKPDLVLHLAAVHFIPYCNSHPYQSANINIQGTINLLEAAKRTSSVQKVFFASTAAVYPVSDLPLTETMSTSPSEIYGLTKIAGEQLFQKFHLETKIPTVICRFFNAFGPNETNPHLIPEILTQVQAGNLSLTLGNTAPKRDYIHTQDVADAVKLLLEKFTFGVDVFNLGQGQEYSVLEVVAAFEKALDKKFDIRIDESKVRRIDRLHLQADITKLSTFINWKPATTLEEGIAKLVEQAVEA